MTKRKLKASRDFASNREVATLILDIRREALFILPMYARLHSLGLEPPRGESLHVSGSQAVKDDGSVTGYVPELAVEARQAEARRASARWVARQLRDTAKTLFLVRQGLESHVGPGPGYRQPTTLGSDALVTVDEFSAARQNQTERLRQGAE